MRTNLQTSVLKSSCTFRATDMNDTNSEHPSNHLATRTSHHPVIFSHLYSFLSRLVWFLALIKMLMKTWLRIIEAFKAFVSHLVSLGHTQNTHMWKNKSLHSKYIGVCQAVMLLCGRSEAPVSSLSILHNTQRSSAADPGSVSNSAWRFSESELTCANAPALGESPH